MKLNIFYCIILILFTFFMALGVHSVEWNVGIRMAATEDEQGDNNAVMVSMAVLWMCTYLELIDVKRICMPQDLIHWFTNCLPGGRTDWLTDYQRKLFNRMNESLSKRMLLRKKQLKFIFISPFYVADLLQMSWHFSDIRGWGRGSSNDSV